MDGTMIKVGHDHKLNGERVKLIHLQPHHGDDLAEAGRDSENWKWMMERPFILKNGLSEWIRHLLECQKMGTDLPFAIHHHQAGRAVGIIRLYGIDRGSGLTRIATWIEPEYQGRGLNDEVKFSLLEYVFEKMLLKDVEFSVHKDNARSLRALKNIGATHVRTIVHDRNPFDQSDRTSYIFMITNSNWPTVKQQLKIRMNDAKR